MFIFCGGFNPIQKWSLFGFVHVAVPHHVLYGQVPRWLAESALDVDANKNGLHFDTCQIADLVNKKLKLVTE
jgi:hypothetical protein